MRSFLIVFVMLSVGCSKQSPPHVPSPLTKPTPVLERFDSLTAETVVQALKVAKVPVVKEVVYTDATDQNHLLGRPHQYTSKISFEDNRIMQPKQSLNNTIEAFTSAEDLENRRAYVESIGKKVPLFAQYMFVHKNVLLRLGFDLTPNQAKEYERVLNSL